MNKIKLWFSREKVKKKMMYLKIKYSTKKQKQKSLNDK